METFQRLRLHNHLTNTHSDDSLHSKAQQKKTCWGTVCKGSLMRPHSLVDSGPRTKEEVLHHAKDFIEQYFSSIRRVKSDGHETRWKEVEESIKETGTYELTETELVYGAKLAWRNAPRCIGRIQWSKLQVFDCRSLTSTHEMFQALCNHIKYSTNKGSVRSAITIFPQRTEGKGDFKVWNPQLIMYAGYRNDDGSITGDPANVDFTDVCMKQGWHGNGGWFDLLPLLLSANGQDPEMFCLPTDLVLEVKITHPTFEWFEDLGMKWYAVPAVSNMLFDCGGLQFPGAPFNGWYMNTEIACRNFCDSNRYNFTEKVAQKMGLDTTCNSTLWKDRAVLEVNAAVLHSFQKQNVIMVDHHTASEWFMKHYENEQRLRNGIPGDWVWIVPPMSSHLMSVFHQELANYLLYPAYLYQEPAWKTHVWKATSDQQEKIENKKLHFKSYASIAKVTSKLYGSALSKRIKVTILYATETGKSEHYALKLADIFGHAFHPKVYRMDEYDMSRIEHETLLLIVVSTFGNGDPPENGQNFAHLLYSLKIEERTPAVECEKALNKSASFIKANSVVGKLLGEQQERIDLLKNSEACNNFGILSTVRFAVFGLGSSAYPNFCSFGNFVDKILGELGGERILTLTKGDELCGQEQAFKKWARDVFSVACNTFCLDSEEILKEVITAFETPKITESNCQFVKVDGDSIVNALSKYHSKQIRTCKLMNKRHLHCEGDKRMTIQLEMTSPQDTAFQPGDHVGIISHNRPEIVDGIIRRIDFEMDPDQNLQLQYLCEKRTLNGVIKKWVPHDRLPSVSLRLLLSKFLDVTTPASPALLKFLSRYANEPQEKQMLIKLATDSRCYEDWKHYQFPHLLEVLQEFPSIRIKAELLVSQLRPLQPRFYSISSAPALYDNQIHLTVAVVQYHTQDGNGPLHHGVASNYLNDLNVGDEINLFIRSAPNFHLPEDNLQPVIMVGPGTGIAPFRSFWQHRMVQNTLKDCNPGKMTLFYGCRLKSFDLYQEEKATMVNEGVLNKIYLALSRDPTTPKTYVQDLMRKDAENIYSQLVLQKGHFYVCGDCAMAEDVLLTLKGILKEQGKLTDREVETYIYRMRDDQRYHEDIFGITLRTAEVQSKLRAKIREESQCQ